MSDSIFTVDSLAERWQCNPHTVYGLLANRQLKGFKVGKAWRITANEVIKFEEGELP